MWVRVGKQRVRKGCLIAVALIATACQPGLRGPVPQPGDVNPITTGQISVTALQDPAAPPQTTAERIPAAARSEAPPIPRAAEASAASLTAQTLVPQTPAPQALAPQTPAPQTPAPQTPAPQIPDQQTQVAPAAQPKSPGQTACEKGKGAWVAAGTTGTMSCQTPQRDGGRQCSRDSDCDGQCLARSRTCAPYAPLFGCNDILQDNGQRVTLCIE